MLQHMYKDARAEICALKAENKELKRKATSMENKEVKRQATCMARFGTPSYFAFDGQRRVNSLGENTKAGPSLEAGPSKVSQSEIEMKKTTGESSK
ncbi:unnamed protein product [Camellia sinensis]